MGVGCAPKNHVIQQHQLLPHIKQLAQDGRYCKSKPRTAFSDTANHNDVTITRFKVSIVLRTKWADYRYYPVDEDWQKQACRSLHLFVHLCMVQVALMSF